MSGEYADTGAIRLQLGHSRPLHNDMLFQGFGTAPERKRAACCGARCRFNTTLITQRPRPAIGDATGRTVVAMLLTISQGRRRCLSHETPGFSPWINKVELCAPAPNTLSTGPGVHTGWTIYRQVTPPSSPYLRKRENASNYFTRQLKISRATCNLTTAFMY